MMERSEKYVYRKRKNDSVGECMREGEMEGSERVRIEARKKVL